MAWGNFSIADAIYDNKRFDAGDEGAYCSFLKPDGTKLYLGYRSGGNAGVKQYSLSTPFDVSTASYDTKAIGYIGSGYPQQIFFKPDGTEIYISCSGGSTRQYTLSTAWDISTASYTYNLGYSLLNFYITSDGLTVFRNELVSSNRRVYKYTMSTAWALSSIGATSDYISIHSLDTSPEGIFFKDDGSKMYIYGQSNNRVYQWSLSTAWDITTASYDSIYYSPATQLSSGTDLTFKNSDGSKMYISDYRYVYQYSTYNPTSLKSWNGLAVSSIKSINGLAIANIKSINGLS